MGDDLIKTIKSLYYQAETHENNNDFGDAKDCYCEIFRISEFNDIVSLAGCASALLKQNRISEAAFCYEMTLEIISESSENTACHEDLSLTRKLYVN